ncbi:hypothetical protein H5T51_09615, partial [Candidatus Bathyarchaeota archaeon]|nr:hypothetical protein [Candidatus Bathyarchaeota archaeon]
MGEDEMFSGESKVLDLGSYAQFASDECIKEKFNTFVLDEGGLSSPLSISLVIPTKFEPEGIHEIEEAALHRILAQCSELVDAGYLDEIIIMGATRKDNGEPDFTILQKAVNIAYEELGLFREQVDLLNKYKSQNERAKRGLIDFFLKVVHQFDQNIAKVLAKFGVFGVTGFFGILPGKGSGLWLSIPLTRGDIICFVDADIMNFSKEYVVGLCHPIIYSWNLQEAAIKLVKAYYNRLTVDKDNPKRKFLGGRVCRLLIRPLLKSITETFNLYVGLETVKYPLAGEFALSRDLLERISLPSNYAIEMAVLFQTYDITGPNSIAQLDLGTYHHIGRKFESLENMARQIVNFVFRVVNEKIGRPLTREEKDQLLVAYEENVSRLLNEYEKTAIQLKEEGGNLEYSMSEDLNKKKILQ